MSYPTPQDFQEAIQNPQHNLQDEELQSGELVLNTLGLPRVMSGSFASVYKFICNGKPVAVRCFLRDIESLERRYERISEFVMSDDLPYTVSFQYLRDGIRIHGSWYPILKMEWVDGECLDSYLRRNIRNSGKIAKLRERFEDMAADLQRAGIAHGDLQHGNIMVINNGAELRLVDYDGMYVPSLRGNKATELGHRNYQHPLRNTNHFSAQLDNFAAWSICTSLKLMEIDPALTEKLAGLDECLLFKHYDYQNPERSKAFHILEQHQNEEVKAVTRAFRAISHMPIDQLPVLGPLDSVHLTELPELVPLIKAAAHSSNTSEWWRGASGDIGTNISAQSSQGHTTMNLATASNSPAPVRQYTTPYSWPTLDEYCAAFTRPGRCFVHGTAPKLQLRRKFEPVVGKHSVIFRVRLVGPDSDRMGWDLAMKVFRVGDRTDLLARYERVEQFISSMDPVVRKKHFLKVRLYKNALNINGRLYPFVLMPWIEGPTLKQFLTNPENEQSPAWKSFPGEIRSLSECLRQLRAVHGDIEPTNLMFDAGHLKLIDYDTMVLPDYNVIPPQESDISCRHPLDDGSNGCSVSDNFSLWLLDTNGLVTQWDMFKDTSHVCGSSLFLEAAHCNSPYARLLAQRFESFPFGKRVQLMSVFCETSPLQVPPLTKDGSVSAAWMQLHGPKPSNAATLMATQLQNSQLVARLSAPKGLSTTSSQPLIGLAKSTTNKKLITPFAIGSLLLLGLTLPNPLTLGCLAVAYAWLCPDRWLAKEMRVVATLLLYSAPGTTLIWLLTVIEKWAMQLGKDPNSLQLLATSVLLMIGVAVAPTLFSAIRMRWAGITNVMRRADWPIVGQANELALVIGPALSICWWAGWALSVPEFAVFMTVVGSLVVLLVNAGEQPKRP